MWEERGIRVIGSIGGGHEDVILRAVRERPRLVVPRTIVAGEERDSEQTKKVADKIWGMNSLADPVDVPIVGIVEINRALRASCLRSGSKG